MRKLILTVALAATTMFAGAQTLTSKNGTPILPEANDWSIGFDATPMLNYFGNFFNGTQGNSVSMNYPSNNPMTIVGKMVVDENTAYRAKIALNFGSRTLTTGAAAFNNHADSIGVATETSYSNMNITLGAGIQKWRGKGRLKGYYGAEVMIGLGHTTDSSKTYAMDLNPAVDAAGSRQNTDWNSGSMFGIGVNGFIGVEYFFAPKMSLSAEYTWGIAFTSMGAQEVDYKIVENTTGTPQLNSKTEESSGGESSFNVGVGNTVTPNVNNSSYGSGSIVLSFYF
jgi:hypothetical protein